MALSRIRSRPGGRGLSWRSSHEPCRAVYQTGDLSARSLLTLDSGLGQALEVPCPVRSLLHAQLVQQAPRIQPRVVAVVEMQPQRVVAHRLGALDPDLLFPGLQHALAGTVAGDLGGGREHPQIFERQLEMRPVVERDFEDARARAYLDLGRLRHAGIPLVWPG